MTTETEILDQLSETLSSKLQATAIKNMTTRLAKIFAVHSVAFLKHFATFEARFTESLSNDELDSTFDFSAINDQMIALIQEFVEKGLTYGASALIKQFDIDTVFSLENPRAVAYTENYAATTVKGINETSKAELRNVLARGVDNGWSYERVARAIRDVFNIFSSTRAHLIAVTEIGNAYQEGNMIVARDLQASGLTVEKHWLSVGDDRVDPDCQANDDEGWLPVTDAFSSGNQRPLAHPRCRCVLQFRRAKTSSISNTESITDDTITENQSVSVPTAIDRSEDEQIADDTSNSRSQRGDGRKLRQTRK